MLWLALQFPHLAIDTRPGAETQTEPLAISEAQGARRIIIAATSCSARSGPGPQAARHPAHEA